MSIYTRQAYLSFNHLHIYDTVETKYKQFEGIHCLLVMQINLSNSMFYNCYYGISYYALYICVVNIIINIIHVNII